MAGRAAVLAGLLVAAAVLLALGGPSQGAVTEGDADRTLSAVAVGRQVFARMGCGGCHRLAAGGGDGRIGPALDERLPGYHAARLRARIVDPYPAGEPAYFAGMPDDYGRRMSARELDALVAFLLAARRG